MEDKQDKGIGLAGTVIFHTILIVLLILGGFTRTEHAEAEGILVMVGVADGIEEVGAASRPDPQPQPTPVEPKPQPQSTPPPPSTPKVNQEMVTQDTEESLKLAEANKKAKEEKERLRQEEEKRRKEAEEKRRLEEERKKKEAAINNRVNNVFQNSSNNKGTVGTSSEGTASSKGNPAGNSSTGAMSGSADYGKFDLGGRGIVGGLPRPTFSINESGTVVVVITVNEAGKVTAVNIGQGTTTTSAQLRNSALAAARKAVFETRTGTTSQTGKITYYFDIKILEEAVANGKKFGDN